VTEVLALIEFIVAWVGLACLVSLAVGFVFGRLK
jgi:hypothetical protein